jgi:hypothetical protein
LVALTLQLKIDLYNPFMTKPQILPLLLLPFLAGIVSCSQQNSTRLDYQMGEKVPLGPLTYNVIQTSWKNEIGDGFKVRSPQQRFLLISLSVTNGGGKEIALPLLSLESERGQTINETENVEGIPNGIGILRTVAPAQTLQGNILFDTGLASYRLRLTDGGEPGSEKVAWVNIPLHMDIDTGVQAPIPGGR